MGCLNHKSPQSLKSKGFAIKDILCYRKRVRHPLRIICKNFSFCKIPWFLTLDVPHKKPYEWVYRQLIFGVEVLTERYLVNCIFSLFTLKSHHKSSFCVIKWKDSLVGLFKLSPTLGMICINKNVHLVMNILRQGRWLNGLPTHLRSWC